MLITALGCLGQVPMGQAPIDIKASEETPLPSRLQPMSGRSAPISSQYAPRRRADRGRGLSQLDSCPIIIGPRNQGSVPTPTPQGVHLLALSRTPGHIRPGLRSPRRPPTWPAAHHRWSARRRLRDRRLQGHRIRRGHGHRGAVRFYEDPGWRRLQDRRRQVLPHLLHAAAGPFDARSRAQLRGGPQSQGLLDRIHLRDRQGHLLHIGPGRRRDLSRPGRRRSEQHPQDGRRLRAELVQQGPLYARQARPARGRGRCPDLLGQPLTAATSRWRRWSRPRDGDEQDLVVNASQMEQAIGDTGKIALD